MLRQVSRYYYETLTASSFLRAYYPELEAVMRRNPGVETMGRLGITGALSGVLERWQLPGQNPGTGRAGRTVKIDGLQ